MIVRRIAILFAGLGVGWWLFADTYVRHFAPVTNQDTIRFSHFGTYQDYELWRDVIASFERRNPGLRVRQEYQVGLADRYNTKMRQQILSHTLPDVALVQLGPFHDLAKHFADCSDWARKELEIGGALSVALDELGLAAFKWKGQQRGLPVAGGNLLIYINTKCFESAGRFRGQPVPLPENDWTMEDFRKTAKLLTCDFDGDGRLDQFGFWLPRWIYYLPWIWSFGAELTDPAMAQWRLTGPPAERAFDFYRDLALGDRVCPRPDEVPQLFQDVGFLTGKVAMCVNGPWFMPFLEKTSLAESYRVAPIPLGEAGRFTRVTWDGVVMADDLPPGRQANARRFVRFMLSKEVQDFIGRTGRAFPARRASTPCFVESRDGTGHRMFIEALAYSRLQPMLPRFSPIDRAINRQLRLLLDPTRNMTGATMLEQLAGDPAVRSSFPASGDTQATP